MRCTRRHPPHHQLMLDVRWPLTLASVIDVCLPITTRPFTLGPGHNERAYSHFTPPSTPHRNAARATAPRRASPVARRRVLTHVGAVAQCFGPFARRCAHHPRTRPRRPCLRCITYATAHVGEVAMCAEWTASCVFSFYNSLRVSSGIANLQRRVCEDTTACRGIQKGTNSRDMIGGGRAHLLVFMLVSRSARLTLSQCLLT